MNKLIGYVGTQLLAFCGLPMAIDVITKGSADGYSGTFLFVWGIGEILCLYYVYVTHKDWPLILNYIINIAFIGIVVYYKI